MLRFDKVIKPEGLFTFRVAYTAILDNKGLYLIQTGSGFPPNGYVRGRKLARILAKPIVEMRTKNYIIESENVERQINQFNYADFPLGKRGVFVTRSGIKSVNYSKDKHISQIVKLKTTKGKFKLAFYLGWHDWLTVEDFVAQLTNLGRGSLG